jgi:hypothetical protein
MMFSQKKRFRIAQMSVGLAAKRLDSTAQGFSQALALG